MAGVYSASGLHPDAQALYDSWLQEHPRPDRLPEKSPQLGQQASALNGACWSRAVLKRDLDTALADCNAAIKLQPKSPAVLDSRGLVHLRRGEYDLAIADYDAVLKLNPKQAISLYARGVAKARKGLAEDSRADIAAATALDARVGNEAGRFGLALEEPPAKP